MTLPGGDRIKETSATSGTASFVLTGAVSGKFREFPASLDGKHIRYVAEHITAAEAESGFGVYTHATRTLTRLYRYSPTPGGAAVSFSGGGLHVACTGVAADFLPHEDTVDPTPSDDVSAGFLPGMEWLNTATPSLWKCVADGVWVRIDVSSVAVDTGVFTQVDGTEGEISVIDNSHAGQRVSFDQAMTLANTFASGYTGLTRPYVVLWNVAATANTITVEAGASGTGQINGASSYTIPPGGRIILEGESNVVGDEPQCTATGDSTIYDFGASVVRNVEVRDLKETVQALGNISGSVSINFENGAIATGTLTGAITSLAFTNMDVGATITLILNLAGFSLAHPSSTQWPDGTGPTLGTGKVMLSYFKETAAPLYQGIFGGGNRA